MKRILGLDCSSKTIGYCILELDEDNKSIKLIEVNYIKPIQNGNLIERIANTRNTINQLINKFQPNYIAIEDIISFMKGHSTAQTIIMLTTFNRMICLAAYDYLGKSPSLYNVMTIRHGLKINKIFPKKEDMPELVAKHLKIDFPYQLNKKGKFKIENYDMADGVAVALYHALFLTGYFIKDKAKKNKVKKKRK